MFQEMKNVPAIKRGMCTYNNSLEYEVKIVKWHTFYGTGDYEDPDEIREDRDIECYYVFYEDLTKKGMFNASGGAFLSVKDAVTSAEKTGNVKWMC